MKDTNSFLFSEFKQIREVLSMENQGLEKKAGVWVFIAWTTRGQLGLESKIIATTGFQRGVFPQKNELINAFVKTMKS